MVDRAELYDAVQESHDYADEATKLHTLIQERAPGAKHLLDVACGTGRHLAYLSEHYEIEGLDVDPEYVETARRRVPDATFHTRDMTEFDLGHQFDAVICLGSAIGYVQTFERLKQAVASFARHIAPAGIVVVEPFLSPERWSNERRGGIQLRSDGQVAWASLTGRDGELATIDMAFLLIGSEGIEHAEERHVLGLFSDADYSSAFRETGLDRIEHQEDGLNRKPRRGLYIARR